MFTEINPATARRIALQATQGEARAYNAATDLEGFSGTLQGQFAIVCVDMRRQSATRCNTPEAVHRSVHLASGDQNRQVVIVPESALANG